MAISFITYNDHVNKATINLAGVKQDSPAPCNLEIKRFPACFYNVEKGDCGVSYDNKLSSNE